MSVAGIVTAEAGRLGTPSLIAIGDATAGVLVRVPDGAASPGRGAIVSVAGPLAEPYGQLEIRPERTGFAVIGTAPVPTALLVAATDLGEGTEGRLVELVGTAATSAKRSTSGDIAVDLVDPAGTSFRVMADASSGIASSDIAARVRLRITGIVGQHATKKGALDGYRVWLRDKADVRRDVVQGSGASPAASLDPRDAPVGSSATRAIASLRGLADGTRATIEGIVSVAGGLLDGDQRRIVVEDGTAALEVVLPSGTASPRIGARFRASGELGHAWGAPRLRADDVTVVPGGATVTPVDLATTPGSDEEWLLVRISGSVVRVERMGDRWRAEVLVGADRVLVTGLAAARIPSTVLVEGRVATIVGIVRRPYPTATDRRWAVVPRDASDIAIGPATAASKASRSAVTSAGPGGAASGSGSGGQGSTSVDPTPDTDLATLRDHVGETVRVGGLVADLHADGFSLDDATAVARVVLSGDATPFIPLIVRGEALSARGTVALAGDTPIVVVSDPASLVRVGSLGEALPIGLAPGDPSPSPEPTSAAPGHGASSAMKVASLDVDPASGGLAALACVSALSLAATALRRRAMRRRLVTVAAARLGTLPRRRK